MYVFLPESIHCENSLVFIFILASCSDFPFSREYFMFILLLYISGFNYELLLGAADWDYSAGGEEMK